MTNNCIIFKMLFLLYLLLLCQMLKIMTLHIASSTVLWLEKNQPSKMCDLSKRVDWLGTLTWLFWSHLENTDTAGTRPGYYTRDDLHACTLAASKGLHTLQSSNLHRQCSLFTAPVPGVMQLFMEVITSPSSKDLQLLLQLGMWYVYGCVCTPFDIWFQCTLIQSVTITRAQRIGWLLNPTCSLLTLLGTRMHTHLQLCVRVTENTCWDMQEYFLVEEKLGYALCFTFPFIPQDKSQSFNPRHHFHFIHSLSHHFPLRLSPILTHSISSSISVSAWWVSPCVPLALSLAPSYLLSFITAFAIIFVLEIKLSYFSVQTHMHAVSCSCWGIYITSPPSLPSFLHSCLLTSLIRSPLSSPLLLLLLALSLPRLVFSLLWIWVFVIKINLE